MTIYKRASILSAVIAALSVTSASAQWSLAGNGASGSLGSNTNFPFHIITSNTARGAITTAGNVGIGTTSPATLLHVNQASAPQVRFGDSDPSNTSWDLWGGSNFLFRRVIGGVSTDWIKFDDVAHAVRIGPSSQFYISLASGSVGNVGIGTTSPAFKLQVAGTITPGTNCGGQNIGGDVGMWNTVYACNGTINTSDADAKENIRDIHHGLDAVLKLRPVSFTWKHDPAYGTKLGLIAQEVKQVLPEVVNGDENSPVMGVFYSDIIPVVVKAIQEQQGISVENGNAHSVAASAATSLDERLARLEAAAGLETLSGVESPEFSANGVMLNQNDPNPTDGLTTISYFIPESVAKAELVISDIATGREVSRNAVSGRGTGETEISVQDLTSGTYIYSIVADGKLSASRKMVVAK